VATHPDMLRAACRVDPIGQRLACYDQTATQLDLPALYTQHFDLVWRNLRRLGVPDALLDDAVQDVFLVVHRRQSEFLGQSSLKTWIIGIVLRVAHDYRRSHRRHSARVALYAEHNSLHARSEGPDELVELREAAAFVRSILAGFSEQERNLFVLIELEELSLREAAEATNLSPSTCQRRLIAARKAFDVALRRRSEATRKRAKS
jgi:RNA polymerase sigma-70 factor, ECF subfamily